MDLNKQEELKISCRHHYRLWGYCYECQTDLAYRFRKHRIAAVIIGILTAIAFAFTLLLREWNRAPYAIAVTVLGGWAHLTNWATWWAYKWEYENKHFFNKLKKKNKKSVII